MEQRIRITSLEEFIEKITELNDNLKIDIMSNEVLFFRGQSDEDFKLIPSIVRYHCRGSNVTMLDYERNLIELAKFKLPSVFGNIQNPINLLALLQHHGIPTRLLDVTQNPLVALFFACADNSKDGEVFVFKDNQYDITPYPIYNAIADTYRFAFGSRVSLENFYKEVIEQPYFLEQRYVYGDNYTAGGNWIAECCKKTLFIRAQELSSRQKAQQGSFILFPNDIKGSYFQKNILPIPKDHNSIIKNFIIPKECKEKLLKQLSIVGISKSMLFPDNINYLCEEITNSQKIQLTIPKQ